MKRIVVMILCVAMAAVIFAGCNDMVSAGQSEADVPVTTAATSPAEETTAYTEPPESTVVPTETEAPVVVSNDFRIALITMDRFDRHWTVLEEGAMKAAAELGCEVVNLSPVMKNDAMQAEQIRNAVSTDCQAIIIAPNSADAVSPALQEAVAAGVRILCVDAPADVEAEATFATDYRIAGRTAAETMIAGLEASGIMEGAIGIVGTNTASDTAVQCEAGFREAFEGKNYILLETEYSEGDAARSQTIAENYIAQGVVGIFGCSEGGTTGAGNAVRATAASTVVVGINRADAVMRLISDGYVFAVVVQQPEVMGYEAVKAACAVLHGGDLNGAVVDTGVSVLRK